MTKILNSLRIVGTGSNAQALGITGGYLNVHDNFYVGGVSTKGKVFITGTGSSNIAVGVTAGYFSINDSIVIGSTNVPSSKLQIESNSVGSLIDILGTNSIYGIYQNAGVVQYFINGKSLIGVTNSSDAETFQVSGSSLMRTLRFDGATSSPVVINIGNINVSGATQTNRVFIGVNDNTSGLGATNIPFIGFGTSFTSSTPVLTNTGLRNWNGFTFYGTSATTSTVITGAHGGNSSFVLSTIGSSLAQIQPTSGNYNFIKLFNDNGSTNIAFSPTQGSARFSVIVSDGRINQTGTANGTVSLISDYAWTQIVSNNYIAYESAQNIGYGFYQGGLAKNLFRGRSLFGATADDGSSTLQVNGTASINNLIINNSPSSDLYTVVVRNSTTGKLETFNASLTASIIGGNGTSNFIPRFSSSTGLTISNIYQGSTNGTILIGYTSSSSTYNGDTNVLRVKGDVYFDNSSNKFVIGDTQLFDGNFNTSIGRFANSGGTYGNDNVAIGYGPLLSNRVGQDNVAIGYLALQTTTNSNYNVAIGANSLNSTTTGNSNVGIGWQSLYNNATGSNNIAIGYNSAPNIRSTSNNTFIGHNTGVGISGSGVTVIGASVSLNGTFSNSLILSDGFGNIKLMGSSTNNILIGTTSDSGGKLQIVGGVTPIQLISSTESFLGTGIGGTTSVGYDGGKDASKISFINTYYGSRAELGYIKMTTDTFGDGKFEGNSGFTYSFNTGNIVFGIGASTSNATEMMRIGRNQINIPTNVKLSIGLVNSGIPFIGSGSSTNFPNITILYSSSRPNIWITDNIAYSIPNGSVVISSLGTGKAVNFSSSLGTITAGNLGNPSQFFGSNSAGSGYVSTNYYSAGGQFSFASRKSSSNRNTSLNLGVLDISDEYGYHSQLFANGVGTTYSLNAFSSTFNFDITSIQTSATSSTNLRLFDFRSVGNYLSTSLGTFTFSQNISLSRYGLLIDFTPSVTTASNVANGNISTFSSVNSWGVYQHSSALRNFFGGPLLIGTSSNNGNNLQVTGTASIVGNLNLVSSSITDVNGSIGVNGYVLSATAGGNSVQWVPAASGGASLTGGQANYVSLWASSTSLTSSNIYQGASGSVIIGYSNPTLYTTDSSKLRIGGNVTIDSYLSKIVINGTQLFDDVKANVSLGASAGGGNGLFGVAGSFNVAIGYQSLKSNSGSYSIAIGYQSLLNNISGRYNISIGYQSLLNNTTGQDNIAIGYQAGKGMVSSGNIAIGNQAVAGALTLSSNGFANHGVGFYSLQNLSGGQSNHSYGDQSMRNLSTGDNNTSLGGYALQGNSLSNYSNNTAIGYGSMQSVASASNNIAIGYYAGTDLTTGFSNIFISATSAGNGITTGSYNVLIGNYTATNTSNYIYLADGQGNLRMSINNNGGTKFYGPIVDSVDSNGSVGQILSATGGGVRWISLTGSYFTNGGNSFGGSSATLGTNNSVDLVFETNNTQAVQIDGTSQNISIGAGIPDPAYKVKVIGQTYLSGSSSFYGKKTVFSTPYSSGGSLSINGYSESYLVSTTVDVAGGSSYSITTPTITILNGYTVTLEATVALFEVTQSFSTRSTKLLFMGRLNGGGGWTSIGTQSIADLNNLSSYSDLPYFDYSTNNQIKIKQRVFNTGTSVSFRQVVDYKIIYNY